MTNDVYPEDFRSKLQADISSKKIYFDKLLERKHAFHKCTKEILWDNLNENNNLYWYRTCVNVRCRSKVNWRVDHK